MIHTSNLPQVRTLRHTEAMEVLRSPLDVMRAVWAPFVYDLRSSGEPSGAAAASGDVAGGAAGAAADGGTCADPSAASAEGAAGSDSGAVTDGVTDGGTQGSTSASSESCTASEASTAERNVSQQAAAAASQPVWQLEHFDKIYREAVSLGLAVRRLDSNRRRLTP